MVTPTTLHPSVRINYDVPEWFNMATMLVDRHVAEGRGANPAIFYDDAVLSYADLLRCVNRAGNLLLTLDVRREERVGLLLPDCPDFISVFLGAMKIGAVPLPINTTYSAEDTAYCIADSRATTLVADAAFLPLIQKIRGDLSDLQRLIVRGPASMPLPPGAISLEAAADAPTELTAARTHRDDPAYWLYSSGTTSKPKGVVHLHQDMVHCVGRWLDAVGMPEPGGRHYSASKLFFSYGLVNSLYMPLLAGASVVLVPEPTDARVVAEALAHYRPARFFATPRLYQMLLQQHAAHSLLIETSSLRICVSAGEALPSSIYQRWRDAFGLELLDGVGSTENGYVYIQNLPGASRPAMSGTLLPGYTAELRDEDGQAVAPGTPGELFLQSPSAAISYWRNRERTQEMFCGAWLKTADIYTCDADGYFSHLGRVDDMFKVNGQPVSPVEVERALECHPAVAEAAVVGEPDGDGLTKPKAYVVLRQGFVASDQLVEELKVHSQEQLAPSYYKHPRSIVFRSSLPRSENHKLLRKELRGS